MLHDLFTLESSFDIKAIESFYRIIDLNEISGLKIYVRYKFQDLS